MVSIRALGIVVIFIGVVLAAMAFASTNVAADQIGDPFVGHITKHSIRYFIIAVACLCAGGLFAVQGAGIGRHAVAR